ncbi:MAG TPA: protein kinase [Thermoanaerobaculia bacterium]|nr:protein kinase [Thermoanaerobaculia bacterium]
MTIAAGTRIGPYEIVSALGAGGMGEVYRAKDTRVDRVVALKVLPEEFFDDSERVRRFEREARLLASLNHPSIATLYAFEQFSDRHVLAMELLDGETLADRLRKGPLPLGELVKIGAAIAMALDAAHRCGVVHRDLKPANVMLTKGGVKLLDFGIAKMTNRDATTLVTSRPTAPRDATQDGVVLGTLPFMAPEQLEGKADARTDIFALGALLYLATTGRRAFHGTSEASLIAAILTTEPPPISTIDPSLPPLLDRVVRTCMAKNPDERWQSAADVAKELEWLAEAPTSSLRVEPLPRRRQVLGARVAWAVAALSLIVAASMPFLFRGRTASEEVTRFKILAPPGETFFGLAVLSPDGRRLLTQLRDDAGKNRLAIRDLDKLDFRMLPIAEDTRGAFWSPDGREIAYFADGKLKRISVDGGAARTLCDAGAAVWGAWSPEGTILFSKNFGDRLYAVPAAGGALTPATNLAAGETLQIQPSFLPDGRHFVYFSSNTDLSKRTIRVGSLDSKETRLLFESDSNAVWADGHLIFARDDAVLAWRFDPRKLALIGEPFPAFENVHWTLWDNYLSLSAAGNRVAYVSWDLRRQLRWLDRKGRDLGAIGAVAGYADVGLSPDGRHVAVTVREPAHGGNGRIAILDAVKGTPEGMSSEPAYDSMNPAWFPASDRVAYSSDRWGWYDIFERPAAGGSEKILYRSTQDKSVAGVFPDARRVLLSVYEAPRYRAWVLSLGDSPHLERAGTELQSSQEHLTLSADGKWMAFDSIDSGKREVCVASVSGGPAVQVSNGGGQMPLFDRTGGELFYVAPDGMLMAVSLHPAGDRVDAGEPQPLFGLNFDLSGEIVWHRVPYAASADGQRFLVIRRAPGVEADGVVVVTNWAGRGAEGK